MDMFSALAEPTRRDIVELLSRRGQLSASDISDQFPLSAPAISQHLKVLRDTKVVRVEKHAQQRIYRLNPKTLTELETWVQKLTDNWDKRFASLDVLLVTEVAKNHIHINTSVAKHRVKA